jgi:4-carboxymuconolactone decarboxylase
MAAWKKHPQRVRRRALRTAIVVPSGAVAFSNCIATSTGRILIMSVPIKADVDDAARTVLAGLALGDPELLGESLEMRADLQRKSGLDPRSFALVKVAALIALDAPPASYLWQVGNALEAGVTPEDLIGVLFAIAPQIGGPKIVAAAPELMLALGLSLPDDV